MTFTLAIVGRPNVGKSTLFNRLVGRRSALVDDEPGVTRDRRYGLGELAGRDYRIVDTAIVGRLGTDQLAGLATAVTVPTTSAPRGGSAIVISSWPRCWLSTTSSWARSSPSSS